MPPAPGRPQTVARNPDTSRVEPRTVVPGSRPGRLTRTRHHTIVDSATSCNRAFPRSSTLCQWIAGTPLSNSQALQALLMIGMCQVLPTNSCREQQWSPFGWRRVRRTVEKGRRVKRNSPNGRHPSTSQICIAHSRRSPRNVRRSLALPVPGLYPLEAPQRPTVNSGSGDRRSRLLRPSGLLIRTLYPYSVIMSSFLP